MKVRLGDIAKEDKKVVLAGTKKATELSYLGLEQIEAETGEIIRYEASNVEGKSNTFAFSDSHVLYGKLRPYLNKVAVPEKSGRCSTEIIPLLPEGVDRNYLALLLRSDFVVDAAMQDKTGSRMPRADMNKLLKLEVSIHESPATQRQIAAQLKAQLAEVEKARKAVAVQLEERELLRRRYNETILVKLDDACRVPLGDLLWGIEAGKSFKTTEQLARPDELGVLKVSAVSWREFRPEEAKSTDDNYEPRENDQVKKGDFIISRANTLELVGAVVRVERGYPLRLLSDKTLRLILKTELVLPEYLLAVMRWPEARSHIENHATGTSDSMRNISQKTIRSIPIPLVPMERQRVIAAQVAEFEECLSALQSAIQMNAKELELLPSKILSRAFEECGS